MMDVYYENSDRFLHDYAEHLLSLDDDLIGLCSVTFNVYSAISNWSGSSKLPPWRKMNGVQKYLTLCNRVNGTVIFNEENNNECIGYTKLKWPNVKWYSHNKSHSKIYISFTKDGKYDIWTGSGNLSSSRWHDSISKPVEAVGKRIMKHYGQILEESIKVL